MAQSLPPEAEDRVLSTLNRDGTRRWIRPRMSRGAFLTRRRIVGWGLILMFTLIPYLRLNGKPLILLDIPHREFTLFGTTFLPTDTMFLMLLLVGIFVSIFLMTALFGRVWCGDQTMLRTEPRGDRGRGGGRYAGSRKDRLHRSRDGHGGHSPRRANPCVCG